MQVPLQLLLDSGASDNFISEDFARRLGFSKRQSSPRQHLTSADGSSASVSGVVHSRLRLGNKLFPVQLLIAPLSENFDVIICRPGKTVSDRDYRFTSNFFKAFC